MNTFTKFAISAAALTFASSSAFAMPVLTMTLDSAGATSGQCAAGSFGSGTFSGTTCSMSSTTGSLLYLGDYGVFEFENATGVGNGTGGLSQDQPALWLNNLAGSDTAGILTVGLVAQGYDSPLSPFPLLSTLSGTNAAGMKQTISAYFDDADTGIAGAGDHLFTASFEDFGSISDDYQNLVTYAGTYSISWVLEVERLSTGANATSNIAATHTQALPGPAGLALLGLGLIGAGFTRRKRA